MVRFGWEDLQLSLDEAHGIAALYAPQAQAVQSRIAELHGRTQGWAAGLVLLPCRRVLAAALGTLPSAETLALIRTLGL